MNHLITSTRILRYLASAAVVLIAMFLLAPTTHLFGIYYCASFWTLVALDFLRSEVEGAAVSTRWSFTDRFLGYMFSAPLIFPARLYELVRASK